MSKKWTENEILILKQCIKKGMKHKEIAQILGRTTETINVKCSQLKIKSHYKDKYIIDIGYKQKEGFLEVIDIIDTIYVKCLCHNCDNTCIKYRKSVKNELIKTCGCKGYGNKICPNCKNLNNTKNKICKNCGFKFDKNCISFIEEYPSLLQEWDNNNINPYFLHKNSKYIANWICSKCKNSWKQRICVRCALNSGCPYCSNKKVISGFNDIATTHHKILGEWDYNKNIIKPTQVTYGSGKYAWWICNKCGYSYKTKICSRTCNKSGCPKCNQSKNNNKIAEILANYNIVFIEEKSFSECKDKQLLRFDFYLPDYNLCIEYQGEQHYPKRYKQLCDPKRRQYTDVDLQNNIKRDQIKRNFCQINNIKLLEIPYWESHNIKNILQKELNLYNKD